MEGCAIRAKPAYNKFKKCNVQSVECSKCHGTLGSYYASPYFDSDTGTQKVGQKFPCFKLDHLRKRSDRDEETHFSLVLTGRQEDMQTAIAQLVRTEDADAVNAIAAYGRVDAMTFELFRKTKELSLQTAREAEEARLAARREAKELSLQTARDAEEAKLAARREAQQQHMLAEQAATESLRQAISDSLVAPLPSYWKPDIPADQSRVVDVTETMRDRVEWLMNAHSKPESHGTGRDSHDLHFTRFKVTSVDRIENVRLWQAYATKRAHVSAVPDGQILADVLTAGLKVPYGSNPRFSTNKNEVYLFHGTKPDVARLIVKDGLDHRLCSGNFGQGAYFAESASKSDQYTGTATPELDMFLSR
jgi:hypothetical protein